MRNHDRPVSGNHPGTVPSHGLPVEPRIPLDREGSIKQTKKHKQQEAMRT